MSRVKEVVLRTVQGVFGRALVARLGRGLYMAARDELHNDMERNGELALVRQLIAAHSRRAAPGSEPHVVLDIGANVGDYTTRVLSAIAAEGAADSFRLFSFEPVTGTRAMLQAAVDAHPKADRAEVVPSGMSNVTGEAVIHVVGDGAGTNSIYADGGGDRANEQTIALTTIDDFVAARGIDKVLFAKCDTEGHDMLVIEGARKSLEREVIGCLQFEYNHRWVSARKFLRDAFEMVAELPYSVGKVTPDEIQLYDVWHPELDRFFEANYVLIHRDAEKHVRTVRGVFSGSNVYVVSRGS